MYSAKTATIAISVVEHCSTRKSISIVTGHSDASFINIVGLERWLSGKVLNPQVQGPDFRSSTM